MSCVDGSCQLQDGSQQQQHLLLLLLLVVQVLPGLHQLPAKSIGAGRQRTVQLCISEMSGLSERRGALQLRHQHSSMMGRSPKAGKLDGAAPNPTAVHLHMASMRSRAATLVLLVSQPGTNWSAQLHSLFWPVKPPDQERWSAFTCCPRSTQACV
jgi:hypothetical protein